MSEVYGSSSLKSISRRPRRTSPSVTRTHARPLASRLGETRPDTSARAELRAAQRDAVIEQISAYNPEAVVCVGPPFGHTRPQWIPPYGGEVTLDGNKRRLMASYQ